MIWPVRFHELWRETSNQMAASTEPVVQAVHDVCAVIDVPFIEENFDSPTLGLIFNAFPLQSLTERADPILVDRGMGQENVVLLFRLWWQFRYRSRGQ